VISKQELLQLRTEWQLDIGVIEKDYVLGWVLAAIAAEPAIAERWIFKGGTCLRKCYHKTYRFSEDLDFTVIDGGPEDPDELISIFQRVSTWLLEQSGIELLVDDRAFLQRRNLRGNPTTQGRLAYRGPNPQPTLPSSNSTSPATRYCSSHPSGARSSTPTATARSRRAASIATPSQSSRPRRHARWPSDVVHATSTTSSTYTATQTCSVSPHELSTRSHRSAPTPASPSRTQTPSATHYAGANRLKIEIDYRPEKGDLDLAWWSRTRCAVPKTAISSCSSSTTTINYAATASTGSLVYGRPPRHSDRDTPSSSNVHSGNALLVFQRPRPNLEPLA
jgi:Nucleotidyl transferase AbiEii toxin, Type IV TA system